MTTLIRRHRVSIALVASILLGFFLLSATTPRECKVPVSQMSQFCVDLIYSK